MPSIQNPPKIKAMGNLDIQNLKVSFHTREGIIHAVEGVDLSIKPGEIIGLVIHEMASPANARKQACEMLARVGVQRVVDHPHAYPHEFSGGMRQRAMIAMALVTRPSLLLADEPTTALDVTVQSKVLNILKELCTDLGVSVLFVSHDLGLVAELADRVVVMYRGKVVEQNDTRSIFSNPQHPYVKALIACRPTLESNPGRLPTVDDFMNPKTVKDRIDRVVKLLEEVGLGEEYLHRYPHEFSGGQRQRICVARALTTEPEFIVCDECVSAMDVSVQAQVLNLLRSLQTSRNLTYLFISHDLGVVKFMSDEISVMQNGKIVENGLAEDLYRNPKSSYTRKLINSIPLANRSSNFGL